MMTKIGKGIKDNISLNAFYAIVGVIVAFTAATALPILYSNISPSSFDYTVFAQKEDNETPIKIIAEIRNILNQTVQEYKQGNYNEAETLAIRAYLDNYEFIEDAIAEKDKALMQNIEVMLREQLRQIIQSKVAVEELQQHIDKINSNLDQAEKKLLSSAT
jgi:hypothetical protein